MAAASKPRTVEPSRQGRQIGRNVAIRGTVDAEQTLANRVENGGFHRVPRAGLTERIGMIGWDNLHGGVVDQLHWASPGAARSGVPYN